MSSVTIRNLVISLILFAVSAGLFGLMVYYIFDQGSKLAVQIQVIEEERVQEASYIKLQRLTKETEEDRGLVKSYFLARESDSIDFLNQIEALAPEVGVSLETEGLRSMEGSSDVSEWIEATFSITGSGEKVKSFIKILENIPYVSRVTSVDLMTQSSSQWTADVVIQVRVLNYDK